LILKFAQHVALAKMNVLWTLSLPVMFITLKKTLVLTAGLAKVPAQAMPFSTNVALANKKKL
jgi:hypothetical protein